MIGELTRAEIIETELLYELDGMHNFSVYYQPKICLKRNQIIGAEALLRWNHPILGNISPIEFIPIAEKKGAIHKIGLWVIEESCKFLKQIHKIYDFPFQLSVNLSLIQLNHGEIVHKVKRILNDFEIEPHFLELEITESIAMGSIANVYNQLISFNDLGVKLALDDFGTGYSSLNYLSQLPIHTLKIDRTFIKDITSNTNNSKIVEAIINVAHGLELHVVAEGVETREQLMLLKEINCDTIQGYYYKQPCKSTDLIDYINSWDQIQSVDTKYQVVEDERNLAKINNNHRKYTTIKEVHPHSYFGEVLLAKDQKSKKQVLIKSIPLSIANFIGHEQIKLKINQFTKYSNCILPILDTYTTKERFEIVYDYENELIPLEDYIVGKTYSERFQLIVTIAHKLAELHDQLNWHGCLIPEYVWVMPNGDVRFLVLISTTPFTLFSPFEISMDIYPLFAPELFKMNPIDSRTDIYNVGALFYYILTNHYPSTSNQQFIPASSINNSISTQVDRFLLKMIQGSPSKRFQWIGEVIEELNLLQNNYQIVTKQGKEKYGSEYLFYPEFIGREEEIRNVTAFYKEIIEGNKGSLLLIGKPGTGRKSIIYESTAILAEEIGYTSGTANQTPFSAIEEVTRKLLMFCFASKERQRIGEKYLPSISRLFPEIHYSFRDKLLHCPKDKFEKDNPKNTLINFYIEYFHSTNVKIVFEIYDAHKLDSESIDFLKTLLISSDKPFGIIGVSDITESNCDVIFNKKLEIGPLSLESLKKCLVSRLGKHNFVDDEFTNWVHFHTGGSLDKACKLLNYLADSKQIYLRNYVWGITEGAVSKLTIPDSNQTVIINQLGGLSASHIKVCQLIALFDTYLYKQEVILRVVKQIAGISSSQELLKILQDLVDKGILLELMVHFRFSSEDTKQIIYHTLSNDEKVNMHQELAYALLASNIKEKSEIAYHFERSQNIKESIIFYLLCARNCFQSHLYEDALQKLDKVLDLYATKLNKEIPLPILKFQCKLARKTGNLNESSRLNKLIYEKSNSVKYLNLFAFCCVNSQRFKEIDPYIPVLERALGDKECPINTQMDSRTVLGFYHLQQGNYSFLLELEEFHKRNKMHLKKKMNFRNYTRWIYNLCAILLQINAEKRESYFYLLNEALILAEKNSIDDLLISIYNLLGFVYTESNLNKAKEYYLLSQQLAQKLGHKSNEMTAHLNLIDCYINLGDQYNTKRSIKQAKELSEIIGNSSTSSMWLLQEVKHLLFIEEYPQALDKLKDVQKISRVNKQEIGREQATLYKFKIFLETGHYNRAEKLIPFLKNSFLKNRNEKPAFQVLLIRYELLKGTATETRINDLVTIIEQKETPLVNKIEAKLLLISAYTKLGYFEQAEQLIQTTNDLINKTSYHSFLGEIYYVRGIVNKERQRFPECRINLRRAIRWYKKNQQYKKAGKLYPLLASIQENKASTNILQSVQNKLLHAYKGIDIGKETLMECINDLQKLSAYLDEETKDTIDTLENHEMLIKNIQLINSAFDLVSLSKNLSSILFENILFDYFHMQVIHQNDNSETICLNAQQEIIRKGKTVPLLEMVIDKKGIVEQVVENRYFYSMPVLSNDEVVLAVITLESTQMQSKLSFQDKNFANQLIEIVTRNIENAILYHSLITDDLTGLYKRNYFMKRLKEEYNHAVKYGLDLSFIMIDIDNFSDINNQYGHHEGDRVLERISGSIMHSLRSSDVAGRFGGEEIIIILPNMNGISAKKLAEKILGDIETITVTNGSKSITASIGVSSLDMDVTQDEYDLMKKADDAELFSKQNGKNQVTCFWELEKGE